MRQIDRKIANGRLLFQALPYIELCDYRTNFHSKYTYGTEHMRNNMHKDIGWQETT